MLSIPSAFEIANGVNSIRPRNCSLIAFASFQFSSSITPRSGLFSFVQGLVAACCMDPRDRKVFGNAGTTNQAYKLMREPWMLHGFSYS